MYYFKPQVFNSMIISIDKIVFKGQVEVYKWDLLYDKLNDYIQAGCVNHSINNVPFHYHFNFNYTVWQIKENDEFYCLEEKALHSFYLGVGINSTDQNRFYNWKLEYNPNKVGNSELLNYVLYTLLIESYKDSIICDYFDLTFDIPINRMCVQLLRENGKKYINIENSKYNRTEYLGQRHNQGFCKLYNKTIESELDYELTRFEVGLWGSCDYQTFLKNLPRVIYFDVNKSIEDVFIIRDTDIVLAYDVLQNPNHLHWLGRNYKYKINSILDKYIKEIYLPPDVFNNIKQLLDDLIIPYNYVNMPASGRYVLDSPYIMTYNPDDLFSDVVATN